MVIYKKYKRILHRVKYYYQSDIPLIHRKSDIFIPLYYNKYFLL